VVPKGSPPHRDEGLTLPVPSDPQAVFEFAMSFNGYEHFGSFERAFAEARLRRRQSLVDLRNELFVEARSSRHREDDEFMARYREVLPLLQKHLA
jgi:hypothetical protein